jgi:hypothetical protein
VDTANTTVPSKYDVLLPHRSAIIPVGTSNTIIPSIKKELAKNASVLESPASNKKIVLMPHIVEDANVENRARSK